MNEQWSKFGLGTWQLGSADWGQIDNESAFAILEAYAQAGGNFIDTADVYGAGHSERIIGAYLKQGKQPFYVATKLGRRGDAPFGWPQNFTYDFMRRQVEDSLKNLGVDSLYLEQLHCIPREELLRGEVFDHLRRLKEEGLIQHFGVSVESIEEAEICLRQEGVASLQIIFNLFRQDAVDSLLKKAKAQGTAIIARVPLASGLLSGRYTADSRFSSSDHRNYNADGAAFNVGETFSGLPFEAGVRLAEEIKEWLPAGDLALWSLKWIMQQDGVSTVIPGASRAQQVVKNAEAATLPDLDAATLQKLKEFYLEKVRPLVRGEI